MNNDRTVLVYHDIRLKEADGKNFNLKIHKFNRKLF